MIFRISKSLFLISFPFLATAQDAAGGGTMLDLIYCNFGLFFLLGVIVLVIGGMFSLFRTLASAQLNRIYQENGLEAFRTAARAPSRNFWKNLYRKLTAYVPMEQERDIQLDHNYDGIRELDNRLPPWWLAMFYISIAFSAAYMVYYHVMDEGHLQIAEYEQEMEEAELAVAAFVSSQADQVNENNVTLLTDPSALESGKEIFLSKCSACHGQTGEGGVGPNMTDKYWIHGGSIEDIFKIVKYGVLEKGMIPWKDQLRAREMQEVSSYILALQGTDPPNGKEPQGELYEGPVDASTAQDTVIGMK